MHLRFWLWLFLLIPALTVAFEPPLFEVKAHAVHEGNDIVYHYRLINNSSANTAYPMEAVQVELGRASLGSEPELTGLLPTTTPPVYSSGVLQISSPAGWNGVVSGQEEHVRHTLWWKITERYSPYTLLPGQTLSGLSVRRTNVNPTYLSSHFLVITNDAREFTGIIEKEDRTSPTLSVSVTPARLKSLPGKLVTVKATITVNDDYDPQPEIKLYSITANEPLADGDVVGADIGTDDREFKLKDKNVPTGTTGRVYYITYSATDASGNRNLAAAVVSVK